LGVADIDGDGKVEIVHGPDWYNPPPEGPLSGLWQRKVFAPGFREMCRTALVDITGNGLADVVLAESKYLSGRVAWFENRLVEDPGSPWIDTRWVPGATPALARYTFSWQRWRPATGISRITWTRG
jgi:hypothetical protein